MSFLGLALFILAVLAGWLLTWLSFPGNWLIAAAAAVYAWCTGGQGSPKISWTVVIVLVGLAAAGEILELVAGAAGAKRAGASRRAAVLALAGSMAGALAGAVLGLPIPLIGPVLGAVVFACAGAAAGAMFGEFSQGRTWRQTVRSGRGALLGRLLGVLAKTTIGFAMAVIALAAAIF